MLALLACCGGERGRGEQDAAPDLDALQAMTDDAALDAALERWPVDDARVDRESARTITTWRLRRRAGAKRIEDALADFERLRQRHGGIGRTPEGRTLDAALLAAGLAEAALDAALARIEGSDPDPVGASRAIAIAESLDEGELSSRIAATRRWCEATSLDDLGLSLPAPPGAGARAVLLVDGFAVGAEAVLPSQWARWREEAKEASLEVVPLLRGFVMAGIRRVPNASAEDETAALRAALTASSSTFHPGIDGRAFDERLGLAASASVALIVDREGRLVARLAGPHLDLQRIEGAWRRIRAR